MEFKAAATGFSFSDLFLHSVTAISLIEIITHNLDVELIMKTLDDHTGEN